MADYAYTMRAQAWNRDSYYVASSAKVHEVAVVASSEEDARAEARRILPELNSSHYYRFWLDKVKDIRLLSDKEKEAIGS